MSLRFDNSAEYGVRTTNIIDIRSVFTVIARVYIHTFPSATGTWQTILGTDYNDQNSAPSDDFEAAFEWASGAPNFTKLHLWININGSSTNNTVDCYTEISSVGWYTLYFARTSGNQAYIGANTYNSGTLSLQTNSYSTGSYANTPNRQKIGRWVTGDPLGGNSGSVAHLEWIKVWQAQLTQAEWDMERMQSFPIRWANLNTWVDCRDQVQLNDLSGNGHYTVTGSPDIIDSQSNLAWGKKGSLWVPPPGLLTSRTQSAFRFRDDDGDEAGASWLASQNTNITRGRELNTRVRLGVETSGDTAAAQYQLEIKKSTDSVWIKVP